MVVNELKKKIMLRGHCGQDNQQCILKNMVVHWNLFVTECAEAFMAWSVYSVSSPYCANIWLSACEARFRQ